MLKKRGLSRAVMPMMLGLGLALLLVGSASGVGVDMRVSTDSSGVQGNSWSSWPSISADGQHVAFTSIAYNLAAGDTNGATDIFVKDAQYGFTTRISTSSLGDQANNWSDGASISADGRYVAFRSPASNLVVGDTNGVVDIFVKDRQAGATTRVSTGSPGNESNGPVGAPSISSNGRFVAFSSNASNLVAGDTNGVEDIFVKDRQTGTTQRVSTSSLGSQADSFSHGAAISADGRYVAFWSQASNLVAGDTNSTSDIFVKDIQTGVTTRVSTSSLGAESDGEVTAASISASGRYVAFDSVATNLVSGDSNAKSDIFVKDTQTGVTTRVSTSSLAAESNGPSAGASISASGRYLSFYSQASNLVASDTNGVWDVFVKDTQIGVTARVSTDPAGVEGNQLSLSINAPISANGRYVAFDSWATNLVAGDTNGATDTFRAPNDMTACAAGKPTLVLGMNSVYWASIGDYQAQLLSIDYTVDNTGLDPAYAAQIIGATATNGVYCATCTSPATLSLGNMMGGMSAPFTLKYFIPVGVGSFSASVSAAAQDSCGNGYSYP